mgnify:CR=1 FL=1
MGRDVKEETRVAGSATVIVAGQTPELAGDATRGERVPAHPDGASRDSQALIVDSKGSSSTADTVVVGVGSEPLRALGDTLPPVQQGIGSTGQTLQHRVTLVVGGKTAGTGLVNR